MKNHTLSKTTQTMLWISAAVLLAVVSIAVLKIPRATAACTGSKYGSGTKSVNIASGGTHRVWVRVMPATSTNNSFYLQIDNGTCIDVGTTGAVTVNQWTWIDYKNGSQSSKNDVSLAAGNHTIGVYGKVADLKIDRIIMTANTSCVPTDKGDNCATLPTQPPPTSGGSSAESMKGVWAIKQFSSRAGANTFNPVTIDAGIAGFSARMPWKDIQTGQNTFDWSAYDNLVNTARAKGKKVRLSVMSGIQAPAQGGWVNYQYPWFTGSAGSQCDSAGATIPVPWDSGLLNAQTTLINEMARKWKADWGSTVVAMQVTGPSARWEELCLPDNTVSQPGYYNNSRSDNVLRKVWSDTMDKWNSALTTQGIGQNRMFVAVSAGPPFYSGLSDDVANDAIAKFGNRLSLQWHFLDVGFSNAVNSVSSTWKSKTMVAWQEWGATTFAGRLMGTGKGAACNTESAADCDVNTASDQDVKALNASLKLAKDAGASYIEVYDDDLKFPVLANAAADFHNQMKGTTTSDTTPPQVSLAASGTTVNSGTQVTLNATASDNVGIAKVEFYTGNKLIGTDQSSPYSINWNTSGETPGVHSITAIAQDAAGNAKTSQAVSITIQDSTPIPSVSAPRNLHIASRNFTTKVGFNVQWDAVNNAKRYKLYRNGTEVPNAAITTQNNGKISATDFSVQGFAGYNYSATAIGTYGQESAKSNSDYGRCDWFIWWFCK